MLKASPTDRQASSARGQSAAGLSRFGHPDLHDRLTIAHVLHSYERGGAEQVALDLAVAQRAAGHEVLVVGLTPPPEGPRAEQFRALGVEAVTVPKGRGYDFTLIARLAAHFFRRGVSLVHTHTEQPLVYAGPAGRLIGAAVVHTKHGIDAGKGKALWLLRAGARFAHAFVAVSEATTDDVRKHAEAPLSRLLVIPNGIDLGRFGPNDRARSEVRAELGATDDTWIVGTVGRLVAIKNQSLLLRAAAPLLDDHTLLVLVGDGPDEDALKALAAELGIAHRVRFVGPRTDVHRILAAFDVFTLSSTTEGHPLAMIEAMATALPAVATAVGGVSRMLDHGTTGLLARPGDAADFGQKLAILSDDRERSRAMGQRASVVCRSRYAASRMSYEYLGLYAAALRGDSAAHAAASARARREDR